MKLRLSLKNGGRKTGRITKAEEMEILARGVEAASTGTTAFVEVVDLIGREGLWLALGVNIFLVTGEVSDENEILFAQRKRLAQLWDKDGFLELLGRKISIPVIEKTLPNPLAPFIGMLKPYKTALNKVEIEWGEVGPFPVPTKRTYQPLDLMDRITLTLAIPGVIRLAIKVVGDIL